MLRICKSQLVFRKVETLRWAAYEWRPNFRFDFASPTWFNVSASLFFWRGWKTLCIMHRGIGRNNINLRFICKRLFLQALCRLWTPLREGYRLRLFYRKTHKENVFGKCFENVCAYWNWKIYNGLFMVFFEYLLFHAGRLTLIKIELDFQVLLKNLI